MTPDDTATNAQEARLLSLPESEEELLQRGEALSEDVDELTKRASALQAYYDRVQSLGLPKQKRVGEPTFTIKTRSSAG